MMIVVFGLFSQGYPSFADQVVTLETITGSSSQVTLSGIGPQGMLLGPNESALNIQLADLLTIDCHKELRAADESQPSLYWVTGGRVRAAEISFDGESLKFTDSIIGDTVGIAAIRAVVWQGDPAVDQAIANPLTDKDQVIVNNEGRATVISGILESVTAEKLTVNFEGKSRTIGMEKVMGVVLAQIEPPSQAGVRVTAEFVEGSQVTGELMTWADDVVTLRVASEVVRVPVASLSKIEVRSDRLAFLSDWDPVLVEQTSLFGPSRSWQRNRSTDGNPLTLKIEGASEPTIFRRGIGVRSYSRLVYENQNAYQRLVGWAGIDTETNGRGTCRMLIRGDGILLWEATVTGDGQAVAIDIDINGMNTLELIVEPGEELDLADHANWASLRVLKIE
jgi:hypothetical protein